MSNLVTVVAQSNRVVRATFSAPLSDFGAGTTGALNPANWTFTGQVSLPFPVAPVTCSAVSEVSTTILDVTADDDLSPEQLYQLEAKPASVGGIIDVADSPNNKGVFQAVPLVSPAERDFDVMNMVPRMNIREDDSGDLEKFLRILNDILGLEIQRVDLWTTIFDYETAPQNFVDLMLQDLAYPLTIALTEVDKRRLLSVLVTIYKEKGTIAGVKDAIRFFAGYESDILWPDWSAYGGWVLDDSELDFDTVLGSFFYDPVIHGTDMSVVFTGAQVYGFWLKVGTPLAVALTADEELKIRALVEFMKPAHTHLVGLTAVLPPPTNVTDTSGSGQITVDWDAVSGATQYVVFWSSTPVVTALSPNGYVDPDNASPFVDAVPTGVSRYHRVCARAGGINGVASARANATAG